MKQTKSTKSHAKGSQNKEDLQELEYLLKSVNPIPGWTVTLIRLVAPLIARVAIRTAVSFAVRKKLLKATHEQRDAIVKSGSTLVRTVISNILEKVQVSK